MAFRIEAGHWLQHLFHRGKVTVLFHTLRTSSFMHFNKLLWVVRHFHVAWKMRLYLLGFIFIVYAFHWSSAFKQAKTRNSGLASNMTIGRQKSASSAIKVFRFFLPVIGPEILGSLMTSQVRSKSKLLAIFGGWDLITKQIFDAGAAWESASIVSMNLQVGTILSL